MLLRCIKKVVSKIKAEEEMIPAKLSGTLYGCTFRSDGFVMHFEHGVFLKRLK